jgi:hypothetical protein
MALLRRKTMLDYYLVPNVLTNDPANYRAVVTQQESAEGDAFLKLAATTLNMSEGEVIGLLNGLAASAKALIGQGWGFRLPGFGHFSFSIRGNFNAPDAIYDNAVQKVSLGFRVDRALIAAAQNAPKQRIHGVVHGPVIDAVTDMFSNESNTTMHSGGNTKVTGKNLKIAGTSSAVGIFLLDDTDVPIPVEATSVSRNTPTELIFICPVITPGTYQVRVTTQFNGNAGHPMDIPRSYIFDTALTVA